MLLKITTPKGIEFEGEADSLTVKTTSGEITILDHHVPIISILAPGTAHIRLSGSEAREVPVAGGFLEMNSENQLTMLLSEHHGNNTEL
jgi:F-type H+-transporting ATPase subunit epsilon